MTWISASYLAGRSPRSPCKAARPKKDRIWYRRPPPILFPLRPDSPCSDTPYTESFLNHPPVVPLTPRVILHAPEHSVSSVAQASLLVLLTHWVHKCALQQICDTLCCAGTIVLLVDNRNKTFSTIICVDGGRHLSIRFWSPY